MQFGFTPDEERFRAELRSYLDDVLPRDWAGPPDESREDHWALTQRVRRGLAERGWLVMSWPREYGGSDASPMMNVIFAEEMAYWRAPGNDRFGTRMIGPTLMALGTEEQKARFLPPIARGEVQWSQGYSEPDAGSDLAAIQTRAVDDGDDFVVNGSKIWNTLAHRAGWMFMLVRTDPDAPRHRGLSLLLCDLNSPGVTVRPIINMARTHSFNEVIFEDVRVPKENLVGGLNNGWKTGMSVLNFERSGIDYVGWAQRTLDELIQFARETDAPDGWPLARNAEVRRNLTELSTEVDAARLLTYEVAWRQGSGEVPAAEASMSKVAATEVNQKVMDFGVELLGMYGILEPGSPHARLDGRMLKMRLFYTSGTILAGTTEIQKNIIAQRGLGLPRE